MKKLLIPILFLVIILVGCESSTISYTVTFDSQGGTEIGSINIDEDSKLTFPADPQRDGYRFVDWYKDSDLTIQFDAETIITENLTLFAKWELSTVEQTQYQITFDSSGGSSVDPEWVNEGGHLVFPEDPEKEGYVFAGWYLDTNCYNQYTVAYEVTENLTLYAGWHALRTGVNLMNSDVFIGGFYITFNQEMTLPVVSIAGYAFAGWYEDEDFTNQVLTVTGGLEDQMYYVKLEKLSFIEEPLDLTALPYFDYLSDSNPIVTIKVKDVGEMEVELFPSVAKNTVDNFIQYIQENKYINSSFHRIIEDFMIQGGIVENNNCSIAGEFSSNGIANPLLHYRGVLSMARTNDKNSATSQFFIVHEDTDYLDGNYATFGGLISGFDILDHLAGVTTSSSDAPLISVVIESITIELNGYIPGDVVCQN